MAARSVFIAFILTLVLVVGNDACAGVMFPPKDADVCGDDVGGFLSWLGEGKESVSCQKVNIEKTVGTIQCPANQFLISIDNGKPVCKEMVVTGASQNTGAGSQRKD